MSEPCCSFLRLIGAKFAHIWEKPLKDEFAQNIRQVHCEFFGTISVIPSDGVHKYLIWFLFRILVWIKLKSLWSSLISFISERLKWAYQLGNRVHISSAASNTVMTTSCVVFVSAFFIIPTKYHFHFEYSYANSTCKAHCCQSYLMEQASFFDGCITCTFSGPIDAVSLLMDNLHWLWHGENVIG